MDEHLPRIVFALPAYNEKENLGPLIERFITAASENRSRFSLELLVIDDGSHDGTAECAQAYSSRIPLEVIRHETNKGLSGGLRTAFSRFYELACSPVSPQAFGLMDADDSHDPVYIPAMVEKIDTGFDVVVASRFRRGAEVHGVPPVRQLYSVVMAAMYAAAFRVRGIRDYSCGYRLYSTRAVKLLKETYGGELVTCQSFACMPELLIRAARAGARCTEVPFALYYDRKKGESKINARKTILEALKLLVRLRGS